jgi:hypothetical protein
MFRGAGFSTAGPGMGWTDMGTFGKCNAAAGNVQHPAASRHHLGQTVVLFYCLLCSNVDCCQHLDSPLFRSIVKRGSEAQSFKLHCFVPCPSWVILPGNLSQPDHAGRRRSNCHFLSLGLYLFSFIVFPLPNTLRQRVNTLLTSDGRWAPIGPRQFHCLPP